MSSDIFSLFLFLSLSLSLSLSKYIYIYVCISYICISYNGNGLGFRVYFIYIYIYIYIFHIYIYILYVFYIYISPKATTVQTYVFKSAVCLPPLTPTPHTQGMEVKEIEGNGRVVSGLERRETDWKRVRWAMTLDRHFVLRGASNV